MRASSHTICTKCSRRVFDSNTFILASRLRASRASYHRNVPRTDVYLKVELDLDPKEKPERVAAEICRTIRRIYGVRKAEVSSMVERDES